MSKELEAWLSKLSLERYAPAFRANAIDMAVLADLTDIDMVELGVAPLGHRKRLLSAIENLRQPGLEVTPSRRAQAERRQVSVLFCDVVGSTALSHRLDPEELAMVMDDYHKIASEKVRQKGGYVAQLQGDGVMAYFGWPTVHEDDASRAIAVGLELVEALPQLSTPGGPPIAVRVGVATGLVVIGSESALDCSIAMGETPNIAARAQSGLTCALRTRAATHRTGTRAVPARASQRRQPDVKRSKFSRTAAARPAAPPPKCPAMLIPGRKLINTFSSKTQPICRNQVDTSACGIKRRFRMIQAARSSGKSSQSGTPFRVALELISDHRGWADGRRKS